MAKELVYYVKNVGYFVGLRHHINDPIGILLTHDNPYVGVEIDDLRNFKLANKRAILEGLIVPADEPSLEWETDNGLTDDEISELLKNYLKLKSKLPRVTSLSIAFKMLNAAKEQNKSPKIINLIQTHIDGLEEMIDDPTFKRGVE
jgi:hypothetical protein